MTKNGQNWLEMDENGWKVIKMAKMAKMAKVGKMAKTAKMVKNGVFAIF